MNSRMNARMKAKLNATALILAAGLAGCTSLTPNPFPPLHPQWSDYQSIQARHYANFPGKTKQSLREGRTTGGQKVETYLRELQVGDRYYGTAWTLLPGSHSGTRPQVNPLLEVAASEAMKTAPGAKLVDKHAVTVDGHTGLTYVIDLPQSNTRMRQQVFIVTGVLVEQTYTGPAGTEMEREPGRFFDSLKLLP